MSGAIRHDRVDDARDRKQGHQTNLELPVNMNRDWKRRDNCNPLRHCCCRLREHRCSSPRFRLRLRSQHHSRQCCHSARLLLLLLRRRSSRRRLPLLRLLSHRPLLLRRQLPSRPRLRSNHRDWCWIRSLPRSPPGPRPPRCLRRHCRCHPSRHRRPRATERNFRRSLLRRSCRRRCLEFQSAPRC